MAFTTKIIHDSSPDMGDSPVEITEQGRPASVGLQGLTPNTVRYVRAELYEDGVKVGTDETSFQTLPVGSMTVAYGMYSRASCNEHLVTYAYTSTYAPSSAVLHVTSAGGFTANYQGVIDSANNTILFDCDDWTGGVVYSCTATLTDVYGESQTSSSTSVTSATMNTISCAVVSVTETSVTLSIDKCLDGGFSSGRADWWLSTDEPDYEPSRGHVNFLETDTTVTVTGLVSGRSYIFNVSATLTNTHIVVSSSYVNATTYHDYSNDYFYLENTYAGENTFTMTKTGTPKTSDLSYSFDKTTWTRFSLNYETRTVSVPQGGKIYLRSSTGLSYDGSREIRFSMSESHKAGGHIASLLDYTKMGAYSTIDDGALRELFRGDTGLTDAGDIDFTGVTTIGLRSCDGMFQACTSLRTAPELPAETLSLGSYANMFNTCTSLTTAPSSLPATTLGQDCYDRMFNGCTALAAAPDLPAATLAGGCYTKMFYGCTSLTSAPMIYATSTAYQCCFGMFENCTALVTGPALLAETLAERCYGQMFWGCTSLKSVTCLATDISATYCTSNWMHNVAASGTFTKAASMDDWVRSESGIPSGWTVRNQ